MWANRCSQQNWAASSPTMAKYVFVQLPDRWPTSSEAGFRLLAHRILVRDCSSFEGLKSGRYIHVAVLNSLRNRLLVEGLRQMRSDFR